MGRVPRTASGTLICLEFRIYTYINILSISISFMQTQWLLWVWCSSLCLFSVHHTHLYMNMCWVPFAGEKHPQLFILDTEVYRFSLVTLIILPSLVLWFLASLAEGCPQGLRDCRDPALDLEEFLRLRSRELKGKEESEVILNCWPLGNHNLKYSYFLLV